ncbi:hypothetical protein D3C86_1855190 [compost metagenome]
MAGFPFGERSETEPEEPVPAFPDLVREYDQIVHGRVCEIGRLVFETQTDHGIGSFSDLFRKYGFHGIGDRRTGIRGPGRPGEIHDQAEIR